MADETTAQNASDVQVAQPKAKSKLPTIIIALLLFVVMGGGGFAFYKLVWPGPGRAAAKERLAKEAAAKKEAAGEKPGNSEASGGDGDVTQVIELQPFIVNLADKGESRYLRMTISLGIAEASEGKVDPLYTTKIRNAILATISTRTSEEILSVEGKAELRKDMLESARNAANKPEVLAIYITDFIIQM